MEFRVSFTFTYLRMALHAEASLIQAFGVWDLRQNIDRNGQPTFCLSAVLCG